MTHAVFGRWNTLRELQQLEQDRDSRRGPPGRRAASPGNEDFPFLRAKQRRRACAVGGESPKDGIVSAKNNTTQKKRWKKNLPVQSGVPHPRPAASRSRQECLLSQELFQERAAQGHPCSRMSRHNDGEDDNDDINIAPLIANEIDDFHSASDWWSNADHDHNDRGLDIYGKKLNITCKAEVPSKTPPISLFRRAHRAHRAHTGGAHFASPKRPSNSAGGPGTRNNAPLYCNSTIHNCQFQRQFCASQSLSWQGELSKRRKKKRGKRKREEREKNAEATPWSIAEEDPENSIFITALRVLHFLPFVILITAS